DRSAQCTSAAADVDPAPLVRRCQPVKEQRGNPTAPATHVTFVRFGAVPQTHTTPPVALDVVRFYCQAALRHIGRSRRHGVCPPLLVECRPLTVKCACITKVSGSSVPCF